MKIALLFGSALLCAGCVTGITVTKVKPEDLSVTGNPWNLPMTQFVITLTRHVTKCGNPIEEAVEAVATSAVALDTNQRYVLQSNGWFATSDITSNLSAAGFNTGLNASSADATGTVISNVVGTAAQLALLVAAAGANPHATSPPPTLNEGCSTGPKGIKDAVEALYPTDKSKKGLKALVESETAALADSTARLALLTAKAVNDKSVKELVAKALTEQDALQVKLTKDQHALTDALKVTSDTSVVKWPLQSTEYIRPQPFQIDDSVLSKWLDGGADRANPKAKFDVYAALYHQNADGSWTSQFKAPPVDPTVGVPVRLAATARLVLCVAMKCPDPIPVEGIHDDKQKLLVTDAPVLQLGQVYMLPVKGGTFKSESASVTLDQNGLPTQLQTSEKVAAAAALTGTAKDVATQAAALPASFRAAELARTQAETNQIKANADLATAQASAGLQGNTAVLTAQAAYISAQNNLAIAQKNAGISVSTAELTAQSNLISAQSTLVTAQANAGVIDQTSVLAAQTALANAQASLINANIALAKAQSAAP